MSNMRVMANQIVHGQQDVSWTRNDVTKMHRVVFGTQVLHTASKAKALREFLECREQQESCAGLLFKQVGRTV